ncbi:Glycosyl transferase OS=Stutzerimonas stutzeri OX=316 GN=CXK99_09150 PE=3 SV=1 [Stutzerimonas stutzeri]
MARRLKRNGGAITLLLTQPTPWQPQLVRAGVVFVPELEGISPQRVLALSGARLALSLSEALFDEEDPRVAQARLAGLPLFAPSASGLAPVGVYDATLLHPYFNDSVLTL